MNEPKIVPPRVYLTVYVALLALLALTYALAHVDLGPLNTPTSLLIAAVKALLVALFFMQVRYSSGLHRVVSTIGVFWLGILLTLSLTDYLSRGWLALPGHWPAPIPH